MTYEIEFSELTLKKLQALPREVCDGVFDDLQNKFSKNPLGLGSRSCFPFRERGYKYGIHVITDEGTHFVTLLFIIEENRVLIDGLSHNSP